MAALQKRLVEEATRNGAVATLGNRKFEVKFTTSTSVKARAESERLAVSCALLGSVSDVSRAVAAHVHTALRPNAPPARVLQDDPERRRAAGTSAGVKTDAGAGVDGGGRSGAAWGVPAFVAVASCDEIIVDAPAEDLANVAELMSRNAREAIALLSPNLRPLTRCWFGHSLNPLFGRACGPAGQRD